MTDKSNDIMDMPRVSPAGETTKEPVISIRGLKKSFKDHEVLKGIDLDVYKGENLVVLGKSGSGKSVLITSDHDPRPLHYQLETNFPGQFGWDYLEQGPEVWRVEIDRLEDGGSCDCCCGSEH